MNEFKTLEEVLHQKTVRCTGITFPEFKNRVFWVTGTDVPDGVLNEEKYTVACHDFDEWYSFKFETFDDVINEFIVVEESS